MKRGTCYVLFFVFAVISLMLLVGCSKPPTEALQKAEQALEEAKQKGANLYVEDLFKKAEEGLKKAKIRWLQNSIKKQPKPFWKLFLQLNRLWQASKLERRR